MDSRVGSGGPVPNKPLTTLMILNPTIKVRSEKLQNESSPNFSNFRPRFSTEFSSELFKDFSCFVS